MNGGTFESKYLAFLSETIRRTKCMADRAMIQFVILRVALIVCSASLPAVIASGGSTVTLLGQLLWSTALAVTVAILAGFDTQFRWGEEWRHFRSAQMTLERMKREYEYRSFALHAERIVGNIRTPAENFEKLTGDVETFLQSEADSFFKFRITEWKSQESKT